VTDDDLVHQIVPRRFTPFSALQLLALVVSVGLLTTSVKAEIGELKASIITFRPESKTASFAPTTMLTISEYFTANAGYTWLNFNGAAGGIDAHYQGRVSNMQAFMNWHPLAGALHFSAGAFMCSNKVTVSGKPMRNAFYDVGVAGDAALQIGSFSNDAELPGNIEPYVGFGWATKPRNGEIGFFADFGILFTTSGNSRSAMNGQIAGDPFQANLPQSGKGIGQEVKASHYAPLAQVGMLYRF